MALNEVVPGVGCAIRTRFNPFFFENVSNSLTADLFKVQRQMMCAGLGSEKMGMSF